MYIIRTRLQQKSSKEAMVFRYTNIASIYWLYTKMINHKFISPIYIGSFDKTIVVMNLKYLFDVFFSFFIVTMYYFNIFAINF